MIALLKRHAIRLEGKRAVVLGRSNIVGKPMAILLLRENCTVTIAHSRTERRRRGRGGGRHPDRGDRTPGFVRAEFIKPGAAVVDVGIHALTDEAEARGLLGDDAAKLRTLREKGRCSAATCTPRRARRVPAGCLPFRAASGR